MTWNATDVEAVARYLESTAGLVFDESRWPGLTSVLRERMKAAGSSNVSDYLSLVSSPAGTRERQNLLDGVTIQETFFFRNGPQIDAVRNVVLPELMRRAHAQGRPLRIWSAGCSTGEEPYTLAMVALEVRESLRLDIEIEIVGTDVSATAVHEARAGCYAGRTIDLAEASARRRWFDVGPDGNHSVRQEVRDLVDFRVHNLVTDPAPFDAATIDLVVCRNVTIYFSRETTAGLMSRFFSTLRQDGFLILGHSETLWQVTDAFTLIPIGEAFVYRKGRPARKARTIETRTPVRRRIAPARPRAPRTEPRSTIVEIAGNEGIRAARSVVPLRRTATELLTAAEAAMATAQYAEAAALTEEVLKRDNLVPAAHLMLARVRVAIGDDDAALEALRRALYLSPQDAEAHFLMAGALDRQGQARQAVVAYRAAASAIARTPQERISRLLDGRNPSTLVALCDQLADAAERTAGAAVNGGQ